MIIILVLIIYEKIKRFQKFHNYSGWTTTALKLISWLPIICILSRISILASLTTHFSINSCVHDLADKIETVYKIYS